MINRLKVFLKLINARLSRSITIWIFLSLVFVKILILIPSVSRLTHKGLKNPVSH